MGIIAYLWTIVKVAIIGCTGPCNTRCYHDNNHNEKVKEIHYKADYWHVKAPPQGHWSSISEISVASQIEVGCEDIDAVKEEEGEDDVEK